MQKHIRGNLISIFLKITLFAFQNLTRCACADRFSLCSFEKSNDKFEPIRTIFNAFNENCLKYYTPGPYITVDERLIRFRGRCPFRVYLKNKPGRYGIKLWVAADVNTSYLLNVHPYTGKIDGVRETNQGERVVTQLISSYYGTWRGVTVDNFFTSVQLAKKLFENNITLTGTTRSNKPDIPQTFLKSSQRELHSSIFGFSDELTLVSCVPKKNYAVNILSTEHNDSSVENEPRKRPSVIIHYNKTKGGVDNADKMTLSYSCSRPTRRWPFKVFMDMVDMAALNAYVIWTQRYPEWRKNDRSIRQCFLRQLSIQLANKNVVSRKQQSTNLPTHLKRGFDMFETSEMTEASFLEKLEFDRLQNRNRCFYCPRNKDKKTNVTCVCCRKHLCPKPPSDFSPVTKCLTYL